MDEDEFSNISQRASVFPALCEPYLSLKVEPVNRNDAKVWHLDHTGKGGMGLFRFSYYFFQNYLNKISNPFKTLKPLFS